MISGLLLSSGCEKPRQLTLTERLNEMRILKESFTNNIERAVVLRKNLLKDNYASKEEQIELYKELTSARGKIEEYNNHSRYCLEKPLALDFIPEDKLWLSLLDKNINGFDASTPELQKEMNKRYKDFRAESIYSGKGQEAADEIFQLTIDLLSSEM